jgi:hypothetical protein
MDVKRQPVVIVFSILAALQVLNGGLALIDSIDKDVAAIISLVIGAITAGASFYVRTMVTPWPDVVSKLQNGHVVAGPASGMASRPPTDPQPEPPVGPKGF